MATIEAQCHRYLAVLGVDPGVSWLRPGVSAEALASAEERLGHELPPDLRALYGTHDGGRLLDVEQWLPSGALQRMRERLQETLTEILGVVPPATDIVPGEHTLQVSTIPQRGVLYELDERPGRLLYLDVWSQPAIVPLARDLATLLDAYIALAEVGLVTVEAGYGPVVQGPPDEVRDVLVSHKVADVASSGIDSWLQWPGAADFSID